MDWLFVVKEVAGWAIPLILTGLVAIYINPIRKALKRGQQELAQEDWLAQSKPLVDRIEKLENHHEADEKKLEKRIEELEKRDEEIKVTLDKILTIVQSSDLKNTKAFIDIYQRDLIVDGKSYIEHKCITPNQLANYKKRYKQYKELGGNGDVEPWMDKILKLEVIYPHNIEYTIEQ